MTATTVSQAVEKRQEGPVAIMWSRKRHFDAVLPASVDVEAFLGTAAGALYASDVPGKTLTLMKCAQANPDSLIVALMEAAALGHRPGTDEYYLTPRMDHGRPKVLGIEGYRGVIERMYRSGAVSKVVVREVCAKDKFRYIEGADRVPYHEVGGQGETGADFFGSNGRRDRGEMVGAYAYAELTTGSVSRVVLLSRDDIFAARDSGGYKPDDKFSPWNRLDGGEAHPEFRGRSMWWKTAAKRLEPWVPTSAEYRREQLRASASAASLAARRPEDMTDRELDSAARAAGYRPVPPDGGIVDAELVDEPQNVPPAPAASPEAARSPSGAGGTSAGGGERPPSPASSGQADMIGRRAEKFGYSPAPDDQEAWLRVVARLAGTGELADVKRLTQDQAKQVIRQLDACKDAAALEDLLSDGVVAEEAASGE